MPRITGMENNLKKYHKYCLISVYGHVTPIRKLSLTDINNIKITLHNMTNE